MNQSDAIHVQQLHSFRCVFEEGGYAAAARATGASVPTVWQHIRSLESTYGVEFFEKRGRQIHPTDAAHRLYDVVDEVLESLESSFDLVNDQADDVARSITIVTGVRMMMEDLFEPVRGFRQRYTNTRLWIRHGNSHRAEQLLIGGDADLALSLEPSASSRSSAIAYADAYFVEFLAVGPKQHPFFSSKTKSLRELVKHDLIVSAPGTHGRDALEQALFKERLEANITIETDNSGFTIACARAGMGLGILAGRLDGVLTRNLATCSLRKQLGKRQIVFMARRGRRLSPTVRELMEEIRKANA